MPDITPIVTLSFFQFESLSARWFAFGRMGLSRRLFRDIAGLRFGRMLGSGGRNGFSILPNWGVYGLLCSWESEQAAETFFQENPHFGQLRGRSSHNITFYLHTCAAHGQWHGQQPFTPTHEQPAAGPIAVITRASIRPRLMWRFWQFVPRVSASMTNFSGNLFAVGIGELPLIEQATFSIWASLDAMKQYAYRGPAHSSVIRRTRELGWYSEEMFARFVPYRSIGAWPGFGYDFG